MPNYIYFLLIYTNFGKLFLGFQCLFSGKYINDFDDLLQFYLDTDKQIVKAELNVWHAVLKNNGQHPKSGLKALRLCKKEMFPNVS